MDTNTIAKIYNSVGLVADVFGAWLVATEVVKQYEGKQQFETKMFDDIGTADKKHPEYVKWEAVKYRNMWAGLILLTFGFAMQIISNGLSCLIEVLPKILR